MEDTLSCFAKESRPTPQVIDLDEDSDRPFDAQFECDFGTCKLQFKGDALTVDLQLRQAVPQLEDELQVIEREEYELTQPITLTLTAATLSSSLRDHFPSLGRLAHFLHQNITLPAVVAPLPDRLLLTLPSPPTAAPTTLELHYAPYRKLEKSQLMRDMKKLNDTFSMMSPDDMNLVDPDILLATGGFTNEQLLDLYRGEGEEESESESEEEGEGEGEEEESSTEGFVERPGAARPSAVVEVEAREQAGSEFEMSQQPRQVYPKQNEIPIYERFKGINLNLPRKEKVKLAEKMLRIGYSKEEIIRFFSGGAEQMELEGRRVPDYRNPASARYREIHLIVARKQFERHTQLLKKHGLPLVEELPEYKATPYDLDSKANEERAKKMLFKFIKEKRFKKLDEAQLEMKRQGVNCSLNYLKRLIEEQKRKNMERRMREGSEADSARADEGKAE